jgi:hypothetical protein
MLWREKFPELTEIIHSTLQNRNFVKLALFLCCLGKYCFNILQTAFGAVGPYCTKLNKTEGRTGQPVVFLSEFTNT